VGIAALAAGDAVRAVRELEQAEAVLATVRRDPSRLADVRFALARALWTTEGDRARAKSLARAAREGLAVASVKGKESRLRAIDGWLADHRT
jgi:hypothetical protein